MNLFNVTTGIENACSVKPRAANDDEIKAYMEWQRQRHGLPEVQEGCELHFRDHNTGRTRSTLHRICIGATFGKMTSGARWEGEGREREYVQAQYENGAYSVIMPGWNAHRAQVTMETLDEAGEIVTSSTLPVEPKKGGIIWDKKAVHAAVGPIAKPKKARKRKAAPTVETEAPEIVATEPHESEEAVTPVHEGAEPVEALSEAQSGPSLQTDEQLTNPEPVDEFGETRIPLDTQGECMAAFIETLEPLPAQSAATPTAHAKRSPAHERAIRRAWAERSASREAERHIEIGTRQLADKQQRIVDLENAACVYASGMERRLTTVKAKRRRAVLKARDYQRQARNMHESREALRFNLGNAESRATSFASACKTRDKEISSLKAELAKARQVPTYFDDTGMERHDAATTAYHQGRHALDKAEGLERQLSEARAAVDRQQRAIETLSSEYETMAKRALKAERDLAAVTARLNGWPPAVRTVGVNFALAG